MDVHLRADTLTVLERNSKFEQMAAPGAQHPLKLWANSGDSHFIEPEDLWRSRLPKRLAELVPRSEKDPDGKWESI